MTHSTAFEPPHARAAGAWVLAGLTVVAALSTWPALGAHPTAHDLGLLVLLGLIGVLTFASVEPLAIYPYLVVVVLSATLGHVGFLVGLGVDFGPAGLLMFASWCSGIGASGGPDMFAAAPWGHMGMLVGCNAGMLLAGCGRLPRGDAAISGPAFVLLCNVGMISGMLVFAGLSGVPSGVGLIGIAALRLAEMAAGMVAGMMTAWWLVRRSTEPRSAPVPARLSRDKE